MRKRWMTAALCMALLLAACGQGGHVEAEQESAGESVETGSEVLGQETAGEPTETSLEAGSESAAKVGEIGGQKDKESGMGKAGSPESGQILEGETVFQVAVLSDTSQEAGQRVLEEISRVLEEQEISWISYDCAGDQSLQNQQFLEAAEKKPDLLLADRPRTATGYDFDTLTESDVLGETPLIFVDVAEEPWRSEGFAGKEQTALLAFREPDSGRVQGQMIGTYLAKHYDAVDLNGDGVISYAMFLGDLDDQRDVFRTLYSVEEANKILVQSGRAELSYFRGDSGDGFQTHETGKTDTDAETATDWARQTMAVNLAEYTEANGTMIEAVICNHDRLAEGAVRALEESGYNRAAESPETVSDEGEDELEMSAVQIPVFGIGGTEEARLLVEQGQMTGTVEPDYEALASAVGIMTDNIREGRKLSAGMEDYPLAKDGRCFYIPYKAINQPSP